MSASYLQIPEDKFAYLVDADFVFPDNFASLLTTGASGRLLVEMRDAWVHGQNRTAMIVPAFERFADLPAPSSAQCAAAADAITPLSECWMYGQYEVPLTRATLQRMVHEDHTAGGFFSARVRLCHLQDGLPDLLSPAAPGMQVPAFQCGRAAHTWGTEGLWPQ